MCKRKHKRNRCEDCIFHIIENGKDKCEFFVPGDGFYIGDTHYFIPNDVTIFDRLFCRHVKKEDQNE